MGKMGYCYGSEWHLLRYLGRHREKLNEHILKEVGGEALEWVDAPFAVTATFDAEWKGVDFLPKGDRARAAWAEAWPQTGNVPNWDAVGVLSRNGSNEWLLVEAKAHLFETRSSCAAKVNGGLSQIKTALDAVKRDLGVPSTCDWLNGYYQYCNRVAFLHFLSTHDVASRLLFIYFTGDTGSARRMCPQDPSAWADELRHLDEQAGLPAGHPLADRIHKLFLPVRLA